MSTCKSCGASVVWCRNEKTGRLAPIDAMPCPSGEGNIAVFECPETDEDLYRIVPEGELGDLKHTSHFVTCPQAKQHRRKQPSARAEPKQPKVSLAAIAEAFERNREGL